MTFILLKRSVIRSPTPVLFDSDRFRFGHVFVLLVVGTPSHLPVSVHCLERPSVPWSRSQSMISVVFVFYWLCRFLLSGFGIHVGSLFQLSSFTCSFHTHGCKPVRCQVGLKDPLITLIVSDRHLRTLSGRVLMRPGGHGLGVSSVYYLRTPFFKKSLTFPFGV